MYEYISLLHPRTGMSIEVDSLSWIQAQSLHPCMRMSIEIHRWLKYAYVASIYVDGY